MKNSTFQKYFTLFVICLGAGLIYKVAYMREAFYGPLQEALNISHEQVGALSTMYGTIALFCYIPGGILADKISAKWLLVFSFIATGLLTFWYSTMPSYGTVRVIYGLMALTTILTYWSAFIKAVRLLGTDSEQGKMFGLSEGIRGVAGTIGSFVVLAILASKANAIGGLKTTLVFYAAVYIAVGVFSIFALPNDNEEKAKKKSIFNMSELVAALKLPGVWLVTLLIFAWYSIYALQSYTTPYLTNVYGLPLGIVGTISIIRQYGIGIFSGPLAGIIGDKIGSPTKVLTWCSFGALIIVLGFMVVPTNESLAYVPMVLMVLLSAIVFAARGTYFATMPEAGIPVAFTGIATGIISFLGYIPDMYIYTQVGRWLDKYQGATGYRFIFIYIAVCAVLGMVMTLAIRRLGHKRAESLKVESPMAVDSVE